MASSNDQYAQDANPSIASADINEQQSIPTTTNKKVYQTKKQWWKNRPDDVDLEITAGRTFVTGELKIMKECLPQYQELERKKRNDFLENTVYKKIRAFWGKRFDKKQLSKHEDIQQEWKKKKTVRGFGTVIRRAAEQWLSQSITNYFRGKTSTPRQLKLKGLSLKLSTSTVVSQLFGDRILAIMNSSEGPPGGIGEYARAMSVVRSGLTAEELEMVEEKRNEWDNVGLPLEVRAK